MVDSNNIISIIGVSTMVTTDTGLPDPDNPSNEIRATNDVILVTDDEEDSDDPETIVLVLDEYQPLATEDTGDIHQSSSDDEAHGVQTPNSPSNEAAVPPITSMEEVLVKEVWSSPAPKTADIEMDSKKVDEVKQAMMNITLPPSSIPDWAADIPEEEWKNQLLKRLQNMKNEGK